MNIKQKMIDAMDAATDKPIRHSDLQAMLAAALAVMADPENWGDEIEDATANHAYPFDRFKAVINHIKELKA